MELYRGVVRSYDPATHTASVLLVGSMSRVLLSVPVSQQVVADVMAEGTACGVLFYAEGAEGVVVCTLGGQGERAACRVSRSSNKTFAYATMTAIDFDQEGYDPWGMHDNVTDNTRMYCRVPGKYRVLASIQWTSGSTGIRIIELRRSGGLVLGGDRRTGFAWVQQTAVAEYDLDAGQFVEVYAYQDAGGELAAQCMWAAMRRMGP